MLVDLQVILPITEKRLQLEVLVKDTPDVIRLHALQRILVQREHLLVRLVEVDLRFWLIVVVIELLTRLLRRLRPVVYAVIRRVSLNKSFWLMMFLQSLDSSVPASLYGTTTGKILLDLIPEELTEVSQLRHTSRFILRMRLLL